MDDIEWLEEWYLAQCNGDWEHQQGMTIETLDNPGWWVRISLEGTNLENRRADAIIADYKGIDSSDWLVCRIKEGRFDGAGGPRKLRAIVECFRTWVGQLATEK
jgi:hypothetical protein